MPISWEFDHRDYLPAAVRTQCNESADSGYKKAEPFRAEAVERSAEPSAKTSTATSSKSPSATRTAADPRGPARWPRQ